MSVTNFENPVRILLVEDSPDDADLMKLALREGTLVSHLTIVEDGEEAMDYLRQHAAPDLILLDLHLPRKNGHEVLAEIKEDHLLRRIPVVILTSTDSEQSLLTAYDLHANCCLTKPADQDQFSRVVTRIEHFWLHVVRRAGRAEP